MSGDRVVDYGDAAASQPAEKALGYGETASQHPGRSGNRASFKEGRPAANGSAGGDASAPAAAEGRYSLTIISQFNALALNPGLLDPSLILEVPGLERLVRAARDRYRAVLLARIIHAVGRPGLNGIAVSVPLWLENKAQGGPDLVPYPALILDDVQHGDFESYNGAAVFELLRQLAAAAEAAPGSRWSEGWERMAPALDMLFAPGVGGGRLLGGDVGRPCEHIFAIISSASTAFGPGSARVRSAIVSAMDNGIIAGLQGLARYDGYVPPGNMELARQLRVPDPRDVFWRPNPYFKDLKTLARLMADIVPIFDSLRYARVVGVQQSFLLLLLFLEESGLASVMPHAIEQTAYVLASHADDRPELLDECGVRLGLVVGAIQSALVDTMDSPRQFSNAVTAVGAIASLIPKVPTPVTVAVTFVSAAASFAAGAIDERRARRARSERDDALANVGNLADTEASRTIDDDRRAGRFIGMRLAGTNEARRVFGLATI